MLNLSQINTLQFHPDEQILTIEYSIISGTKKEQVSTTNSISFSLVPNAKDNIVEAEKFAELIIPLNEWKTMHDDDFDKRINETKDLFRGFDIKKDAITPLIYFYGHLSANLNQNEYYHSWMNGFVALLDTVNRSI